MTNDIVPTCKCSGYCGILMLVILFSLFGENGLAQCSNCTTSVNNYNSSSSYTFNSGTKTCFAGTNSLTGDITFGNNASFCVEPSASLTLGANNYNVNSTSDIFTIDVYGTLTLNQTPTWRGKMFINIHSGATLNISNTINLNGPEITFTNDGTLNANIIQFQTAGATITFLNNNKMTVASTFNISAGNAWFRNTGTLSIAGNYNSDATSVYVNCGNYTGTFNLNNGGKVINTGTFYTSQIDFGGSASSIENYGYFIFSGSTLNPSGGSIYNQGIFRFDSGNISGDGNLVGPGNAAYKGYFVWSQQAIMNNGKVGPNLNFRNPSGTSSKSGMFNNPGQLTWLEPITWGNSEPGSLPPTDCPNANGHPGTPSPSQTSVCVGVDLTSLQPNYANVTYEWWAGTSTSRTTQITSSLTNYTTAGTIYLWARNAYSGIYSDSGTAVVVVPDPVVSVNPSSTSVCVGDDAPLTVSITGGVGTVSSIQWKSSLTLGGAYNDISGATSSTYNAPTSAAGTTYYKAYITQTGKGCEASSGAATVTVNALPSINLASSAVTVCYNISTQTTTLDYSATANTPTTYSIIWNSSPLNGFVPVSNATLGASPITISVPAGTPAGTYTGYLTVKNVAGCTSAVSSTFTVTIYSLPTVTITKTGVSCFGGNDGKIEVTASGGSGSYYFSKDDGASYTPAAQSGPYTFTGLTANDYKIKVKDTNGCTSN